MTTPETKPIQRFSLKQLLFATALIGTMLAFYVACPVYGVPFVSASLVLFVGWLFMRLSDQIDPRQIDERRPVAKRFGIAGAMLMWVGVMMMIFCFPACLVEMTRSGDRMKDYDLYLEEQGRLPPQK